MRTSLPTDSAEASDEALVAGLAIDDRAASSVFVHRFQRRVYGLAHGMVGDPSLAEDIAQEAMTRAWRHAETYDPRRGSVVTWLLTITRHLSIDSLRLRRPEPIDPDSFLGLKTPASALAPDEAAVSADEGARVRGALAELPLDQRRAVVLAAFQGHTAKEISVVEGIPLGTAKTRIRLGLLRLRAIMIREVGEDAPS